MRLAAGGVRSDERRAADMALRARVRAGPASGHQPRPHRHPLGHAAGRARERSARCADCRLVRAPAAAKKRKRRRRRTRRRRVNAERPFGCTRASEHGRRQAAGPVGCSFGGGGSGPQWAAPTPPLARRSPAHPRTPVLSFHGGNAALCSRRPRKKLTPPPLSAPLKLSKFCGTKNTPPDEERVFRNNFFYGHLCDKKADDDELNIDPPTPCQ